MSQRKIKPARLLSSAQKVIELKGKYDVSVSRWEAARDGDFDVTDELSVRLPKNGYKPNDHFQIRVGPANWHRNDELLNLDNARVLRALLDEYISAMEANG